MASTACDNCEGKGINVPPRKGRSVNVGNKKEIGLLTAAYVGHDKCLEVFLAAGANVNTREEAFSKDYRVAVREKAGTFQEEESIGHQFEFLPPLTWSSEYGHAKCVDILIKAGANVNFSDGKNFALGVAAESGNAECIELLIAAGADVNQADDRIGFSSLTFAALSENPKCVELLLNAGADVNHQDRFGNTALMTAIEYGKGGAVKILIDSGVDVNIKNQQGKTALKNAKENCKECLQMLKDAAAKR